MKKKVKDPAWRTVIDGFLDDFMPAAPGMPEKDTVTDTSSMIVAELADMVDVSIDDVALVMLDRGFRPERVNHGAMGWRMIPVSKAKP